MQRSPGSEILTALDNVVIAIRNYMVLKILFFLIIFQALYMVTCGTFVRVFYSPEFEITETNKLLRSENHFLPQDKDDPYRNQWVYFRGYSWKECEDWLLENGYHCRTVYLIDHQGGPAWATTAVKGGPGSPRESVVLIGKVHEDKDFFDNKKFSIVPLHFTDENCPIDWSRFKRIPVWTSDAVASTGKGCRTYYPIPYRVNIDEVPSLWDRILFNEGRPVEQFEEKDWRTWERAVSTSLKFPPDLSYLNDYHTVR